MVNREFISQKAFGVFDEGTLKPLEAVPGLRGDRDLGKVNGVVTTVWLK